tara:strand:+ start:109 stop:549 length:441 start_codon:yes stop_codon:yes gene_type:complete
MVHPDVKAEWKEGTSDLVQKCKAESIELNKKFITTKESDVSDGEAVDKVVSKKVIAKKVLSKVGKREQQRKQLRDEIIALAAQDGMDRLSEEFIKEYKRKPLSEMNTTELRTELKEWHTSVKELSGEEDIDEITNELDTMEIAASA